MNEDGVGISRFEELVESVQNLACGVDINLRYI